MMDWIFYLFTFQMLFPFQVTPWEIHYMWPGPWVTPCILFGWWFRSSKGSEQLTLLLPPWGCKPPQILQCSPQLLHLETLRSVQCLAESFCLCISQVLEEPLRRQPYQAPVNKHFLVSKIMSRFARFGCWIWDGSPRWGSLWMTFPSVSAP